MHRTRRAAALLATLALIAALAMGCSNPVVAESPVACEDALLGPVTLLLSEDGQSTVALPEGAIAVPIRWPAGYGLRPDGKGGDIVDERGETVARIGEVVWLGGGFRSDDGEFHVCGDVMHEDPAGS